MSYLADLVLNALTLFVGMAPDRPFWIRRVIQALWILLAALVLVAWGYGLIALIRAF